MVKLRKVGRVKAPSKSVQSLIVCKGLSGLGLFALKPFKSGSVIVEYRGFYSEFDQHKPWNVTRYANHSCRPNSSIVKRGDKLWLVALCDIRMMNEITYQYESPHWEEVLHEGCRCGNHETT